MGPILNLGELTRPKTSLETEQESKSSQKYASITNATDEAGDAYKRESTIASVSNVGMNRENSRSFTPSLVDSQKTETNMMRKNFEN